MSNKIHFIINPLAEKGIPVLALINEHFKNSDNEWEVSVTKKRGDAKKLALKLKDKVDVIAGYGGDGTIMEIAEALHDSKTALAIIPGGTANIMSKELQIPQDTSEALKLLTKNKITTQKIDMGKINDDLFFLRINIGALADMVKETDRKSKGIFGQLSYALAAIKKIFKKEISNAKYEIEIDGKKHVHEGVSLVVNNAGNVGYQGVSFLPEIDVTDGLFDLAVIKSTDLRALVEMTSTAVLGTDKSYAVKSYQGKNIKIKVHPKQSIIRDDVKAKYNNIEIKVLPQSLKVVVP